MRLSLSPAKSYFAIILLSVVASNFGVTLEQIRETPDLTPKKFASYFRDFEFKFRKQIQAPDVFLATRSGDCDDFSTLAAEILSERGYTPRLITVRMPGVTHVVCYIEEIGAYLDYNNRAFAERSVRSSPDTDSIAASVASSYGLRWDSASEFTYGDGVKRLVKTVTPRQRQGILATIFK